MNLSLSTDDLVTYLCSQLNNFFPEKKAVRPLDLKELVDISLDRLNYCFRHVAFNRYCREGETHYNHLYADHNVVFLWMLANSAYKSSENQVLASKFYYLNKAMHAFDCMYDTNLPDIFLVFHGAGTMLGKANYSDFFVCLQGCTVGSQKGSYPTFGKGVSLTANSSVIGDCKIGNRVSISTRATVFSKDIPDDSVVFVNWESGAVATKPSKNLLCSAVFSDRSGFIINRLKYQHVMNQQLPLVSLIITSYNRESMIAKAIESALEQDYPNLEIIISDNCSTDNTDTIIKRYTNDPRIRYTRNETNIGMLPNYRKATYELSSGSYVTYVSSDDYLTDKSFITDAVQLALKYGDAALIYGRMAVDSTTNGVFWEMPEQPYFVKEVWDGIDVFFKSTESGLLSWGACLMKRTAMEKVGCLLTDYHNADLDSNYKIILDSRVAFINRICYIQVTHTDNNGFPAHAGKLMKSLECFESVARYAIERLPLREKEIVQWKEHFLRYTMNIGLHSLIERNYEQYKLFKKELKKVYPELYASHTKSKVFRKMVFLHPVKKLIGSRLQNALKKRIGKLRLF